MVYELKVRLQHNCPFLEFSKHFGKRQMHQYCSSGYDYIIIPGELTEAVKEHGYFLFKNFQDWKVVNKDGNDSSFSILTLKSSCEMEIANSVGILITKLGGMPIYPVIYENGWEIHKIFCHSYDELTKILNTLNRQLQIFEILSIKDIGNDALIKQSAIMSQILDQLTNNQLDQLIKAFNNGYYDIPRKTRMQDLADELGVTRYAVERTVRSAENKLIRALIPYLYIKNKKIEFPDITEEFTYILEQDTNPLPQQNESLWKKSDQNPDVIGESP